MINDLRAAIQSGKSEGEAIALVGETAASVMKNYFEAASDEALLALLRDGWIAILKNYKDSDSRACIAALLGAAGAKIDVVPRDWGGWETLAGVYERVLQSGVAKIPVSIDRNAAQDDFNEIMDSLRGTYANRLDLLGTQTKWMDNSQEVCDMLLAMDVRIAVLPKTRAANLVRYLATGGPKNEKQVEQAATSVRSVVTYRVGNKVDLLNLRMGPGSNYPVLDKIPAGTGGIKLGVGRKANGPTMWQEVSVNGYTGWVNEIYLEAEPEIGTPPTVSQSRTAETTDQPQSQAQDFIVTAKERPEGLILWVQERDSGRLLINTATNGIALNGDLNTGRRAALTVTSQRSGPNMPIASGVFMIVRDTLSNGVYEASVHWGRPDEVKLVTPQEQARFEAWERQFQPTPCVRDPSLPVDTVRLEAGAESKIRPGYFFPTRPAKPPNYVPTQYVPAKVLRNDGSFLGWQYFAPAQLKRLHEQPNAVSGR